jgi:hypothetical protein
MSEILFYFIFAIIIYFVLTSIFEIFNLEQENFDPSLVPVSSIVTLAKVAQKLINGNGTLINPGNLQIGINTTTPGNLTVTGNSIITGNLSVNGTTTFSGPVIYGSSNAIIPGSLSTTGSITAGSSSNPQTIQTWGSVISNGLTVGSGNTQFNGPVTASSGLQVTGAQTLTGNLNARIGDKYNTRVGGIWTTAGVYAESGTTGLELGAANNNVYIGSASNNVPNDLNVTGMLNAPGNITIANSNPYITFSKSGQNSNPQIYSSGNTIHIHAGDFKADNSATVSGNLTVNGTTYTNQLCIGSTCINEAQLKLL